MTDDLSIHPLTRTAVAATLAVLAAALVWAVMSMPQHEAGLWPEVASRLDTAGASNPVTAVLLNFRAYDTLLEIAVLTIAVLAIWSLRGAPPRAFVRPSGPMLSRTISTLVPLMVLIAGYLLWAGSSQPGGAFPAGAIVASAVALVVLADLEVARMHRWLLRLGVIVGLLTFVGVGLACVALGLEFLEYPPGRAKVLVLVIEVASTVSIGLILASVFAGHSTVLSRPAPRDRQDALDAADRKVAKREIAEQKESS